MSPTMTKKKDSTGKRYPSRENTKYIAIPVDLWEAIRKRAERDDRSVSATAKRMLRRQIQEQPEEGE